MIVRSIVADAAKAADNRRVRAQSDCPTCDDSAENRDSDAKHAEGDPVQNAIVREMQDRLRRIVNSLPFDERQLVKLRYYHENTLKEIAQALDMSLPSVARRIDTILTELGRQLEVYGVATSRFGGEL